MGVFKSFIKDSVVYTTIQLLPAIAGFVLLKLNSNYLSKEEFRVFNLLVLASNFFIITSSAGFDNWLLRKYYDLDTTKNRPHDFLTSSLLLVAGFCLVQAALVLPFSGFFLDVFFDTDLRHPYAQVFILFSIVFSSVVNRIIVIYYRIEKNTRLLLIVAFLQFILQIGFGYWFLRNLEIKLWATQLAKGLSLTLPVILLLVYIYSKGRFVFKKELFAGSASYVVPVLLAGLLTWVLGQCDQFIFNRYYTDVSQKADYSMAFSLTMMIDIVINAITSFLGPDIIAKLTGKNDKINIRNHVHLFILIGCWAILGVFAFSLFLLDFYIDEKYRYSLWIAGMIAATYIFKLLTALDTLILHYKLQSKQLLYSLMGAAVVSVLVNVLFSAQWGAWALIAALFLSKALQMLYLSLSVGKGKLEHNPFKVYGLTVTVAITLVLTSLLIYRTPENKYWYTLVLLMVNGLVTLLLFKKQLSGLLTSVAKTTKK